MEQDDLLRLVRWLRAKRRQEEAQSEEQTTLADDPALIDQQFVRKLMFYEDLVDELLRYAEAQDVKIWLDRRQQAQVLVFRGRYNDIRKMFQTTLARAIEHMRKLLASLIRFYARRYPLHAQTRGGEDEDDAQADMQDVSQLCVVNWRWEHLLERAQKWQEMARNHDWSAAALQIQPRWPEHEDWWANTPSTDVGLYDEDNPYMIESP